MAGELYECKLAALLFLRCVNAEREFHIASNMAAAVSYDDVVLTVSQRTAFLQLKHRQQNNAKIYTSQLFTIKGDFSLIKCWKSYLNIKQCWAANGDLERCGQFNDCLVVMYTNASLVGSGDSNVGSNEMLDLVNTGGKLIQFTEMQHPDIYEFFKNLPRYKQILSDAVSTEQVVCSRELLQVVHKLCNNNANSVPDKKFLEGLLKEFDSLRDLSSYTDFLSHLRFCTKQAGECALNGLIKSEAKALFGNDDHFLKFTLGVQNWSRKNNYLLTVNAIFFQDIIKTIAANITETIPVLNIKFSQDACQHITKILSRGNRKLLITSNCNILTVIKVLQCFEGDTLLIDASTLQRQMNEVVSVWRLGMCNVLVVKGCTTDIARLEDKFTSWSKSKCLVVISDTRQAQRQFVAMSDSFCFSQLETESQHQIMECQVDFQGYTVCLNSLADVSFLQTHLSADVVEQLHYTLQVGQKLQELDPCYLQRTFLRKDIVSKLIFHEKNINLAVAGIHQDRLAELVPPDRRIQKFNKDNFMANRDCRYWLVERESEFTALCTVKDSIHWVKASEEDFLWLQSKGKMSYLKNHLMNYSSRTVQSIVAIHQKVVLVVAEPGMGKSTEMVNIAHVVKQNDPSTWVVRVNLNEWASLFTHQVTALEFLQQVASLKTEFEKHLLEHQLLSGGNIVVLVDGFDEISPNYSDQVFELLRKFSKCKIKKVFVTSRPVMKEILEQKLSSLAFSFRALDSDDQQIFLFKYWKQKPQIKYFISLLMELVRETLNDSWDEFAGIPLQCRMLAEVFHDDANHFCRTGEVRLPPSLDVLLLYEQFVDKKFQVYCDKLNVNVNTAMLQHLIQTQKHQLQQSHINCAMIAYFDKKHIKRFRNSKKIKAGNKEFMNKFNCGEDQTGIVTHIVNSKAVFVHRTFAEYFVAMWLSQNWKSASKLTKLNYSEVVEKFLSRMLAKGYELHTAVINVDVKKFENLILDQSRNLNEQDTGGRTALDLATMNIYNTSMRSNRGIFTIESTLSKLGADVNKCKKIEVIKCI